MFYLLTYLLTLLQKNYSRQVWCPLLKSIQIMCKMPQNIKQIATIGGGGRNRPIDPVLGWEGCRKSLGIEGLILGCRRIFVWKCRKCKVWGWKRLLRKNLGNKLKIWAAIISFVTNLRLSVGILSKMWIVFQKIATFCRAYFFNPQRCWTHSDSYGGSLQRTRETTVGLFAGIRWGIEEISWKINKNAEMVQVAVIVKRDERRKPLFVAVLNVQFAKYSTGCLA